jgi:hypothetical protein
VRTGQGQAGTSFCNIETWSLILGWNWELVFGLQTSLGSLFDWVGKLLQGTCFQGLQTSLGSLFDWVGNFFKELAFGLEIQT